MTMGAMSGWLAVYMGAPLLVGLMIAALCGAMLGLLHAILTVPLGLSQHVSGLGITLFASALAYYLYRLLVEVGDLPPTIEPFQPLDVLGVSDIPILGPILFSRGSADLSRAVCGGCDGLRSCPDTAGAGHSHDW